MLKKNLFYFILLIIYFYLIYNLFLTSLKINLIILLFPIILLIFGIIFISCLSNSLSNFIKNFTLTILIIVFLYFLILLIILNNFFFDSLILLNFNWSFYLNLTITFGIDNLNIYFLILTSLLLVVCLLLSWNNIFYNFRLYSIVLLSLGLFLICTFLSLNLFFFYFFFESTMLPMFLLIGIWGSRQRKVHAVYYFLFYTIFGSIFLLIGISYLYYQVETLNLFLLNNINFSYNSQLILSILFFIGFCVKMPMVPFHIWLPEAHVEAPTAGSVLLAGILLKIGSYGILRFILSLFPDASFFLTPIIFLFALISIIYISCIAIRQIDLKKIIAYSSVAHMNFVMLGLFSFSFTGLVGSVYLMLSHGIVSSALFICISVIYDRYHTRLLSYYGNIVSFMPIYSVFFFFFYFS